MPRADRLLTKNGYYHVMNRGAARRHVFVDDALKELFVNIMYETCEKYRFEIICYCIMGNHYHLLIKTPEANLSEGMRFLNSKFAKTFNKMRLKDGPIFRSRFKSIYISNERYLLNVCRYIHLNPVEAGLVKRPEDYLWSDFKEFIAGCKQPFERKSQDSKWYKVFVEEGNNQFILDFYNKQYLKKQL